MNPELLKIMINDYRNSFFRFEGLLHRENLDKFSGMINSREIIVITGVRRSGKSTLMKLIAKRILDNGVNAGNILFMNFDDERLLNFTVSDFNVLYNCYLELFQPKGKTYIFFDEIQNVKSWENWVNRMYESGDVKIFVTGSNSSILKSEFSSLLTGRNRQITNYPFSFREFLVYHGSDPADIDYYDNYRISGIKSKLSQYIETGGFPEVVKTEDTTLLEQYFKDILFRDIIVRYNLRNSAEIRELALSLASEPANIQSLKRLKNTIGIRSVNSVKSYLQYFTDCFLFFQLSKFSFSVKQQIYNPKKIYSIDTGMNKAVSFSFSENLGKYYEQVVFLELMRGSDEIYYWKSESNLEVDFIIKRGLNPVRAIQVAANISNEETLKREVKALLAANDELGITDLNLLTWDEEKEITENNVSIKVIPIWKFLIKGAE